MPTCSRHSVEPTTYSRHSVEQCPTSAGAVPHLGESSADICSLQSQQCSFTARRVQSPPRRQARGEEGGGELSRCTVKAQCPPIRTSARICMWRECCCCCSLSLSAPTTTTHGGRQSAGHPSVGIRPSVRGRSTELGPRCSVGGQQRVGVRPSVGGQKCSGPAALWAVKSAWAPLLRTTSLPAPAAASRPSAGTRCRQSRSPPC